MDINRCETSTKIKVVFRITSFQFAGRGTQYEFSHETIQPGMQA
jgi:hypothetical protein